MLGAAKAYTDGLDWLDDAPARDEAVLEVKVALLANRSQAHIKSQLMLREYQAAHDSVNSAIKAYRWEDTRLREEFNKEDGLSCSAMLIDSFQAIGFAVETMAKVTKALEDYDPSKATNSVTAAITQLEKKDWPAAAPLLAELFALRADAALQMENASAGEADAQRAIALDAYCSRAQDVMDELHAISM